MHFFNSLYRTLNWLRGVCFPMGCFCFVLISRWQRNPGMAMGIVGKWLQAYEPPSGFSSVQGNPPSFLSLYQSQCAALWKSANLAGDLQRCQNHNLLLHVSIHLGRSWNSKGLLNINLIWIHLTFEKWNMSPLWRKILKDRDHALLCLCPRGFSQGLRECGLWKCCQITCDTFWWCHQIK